ncbi:MAG: acyl-CoA thioesterase/bile acid-CoA:amino acid N-acyltransferase family protein [Pseudomonadota bacterium]
MTAASWAAVSLILAALSGHADEANIQWPAADALLGAPETLRIDGLLPGQRIMLTAREKRQGSDWLAYADYVADSRGVVDTARDPASGGTWDGVDPTGWLWSMYPVANAGAALLTQARQHKPDDQTLIARPGTAPREITLALLDAGELFAKRTIVRRRAEPDNTIEVDASLDDQLRGRVFLPKPANVKRVGVVVLGGSFGGLLEREPRWLAGRGFPSMALGYFKYRDLPASGSHLPLEYFDRALRWFRDHQQVEVVVLMGRSRGAEAALLVAAHFPGAADAVIAQVPSHVVNNGEGTSWGDWLTDTDSMWTLEGTQIAHVPYPPSQTELAVARRRRSAERLPGYSTAPEYGQIWREADVKYSIPVERINVPVLIQAGRLDGIWPSVWAAHELEARCAPAVCDQWRTDIFDLAGHAWGLPGEITTTRASVFVKQRFTGFVSLGGTPAGNARAARVGWRSIEDFLDQLASP